MEENWSLLNFQKLMKSILNGDRCIQEPILIANKKRDITTKFPFLSHLLSYQNITKDNLLEVLTSIYTDFQTKGRGTYGKKWISKKGNFFGTIFFHIKKNYPSVEEFSLINPILNIDILSKHCGRKNTFFKLPNDIFTIDNPHDDLYKYSGAGCQGCRSPTSNNLNEYMNTKN